MDGGGSGGGECCHLIYGRCDSLLHALPGQREGPPSLHHPPARPGQRPHHPDALWPGRADDQRSGLSADRLPERKRRRSLPPPAVPTLPLRPDPPIPQMGERPWRLSIRIRRRPGSGRLSRSAAVWRPTAGVVTPTLPFSSFAPFPRLPGHLWPLRPIPQFVLIAFLLSPR